MQIATDELAKNTELFRTQQQELDQSRRKIEWRNKVLIRQENDFIKATLKYSKFMNLIDN